jgi:hypothetical protein
MVMFMEEFGQTLYYLSLEYNYTNADIFLDHSSTEYADEWIDFIKSFLCEFLVEDIEDINCRLETWSEMDSYELLMVDMATDTSEIEGICLNVIRDIELNRAKLQEERILLQIDPSI